MGMTQGGAARGACLDDATRDACLHSLGDHYATGRISVDELDARIQRALAAETEVELASVMAGLVSDPADDAEVRGDRPRTARVRLRTQLVRLSGALLGFLARRGRAARGRRAIESRPVETAAVPEVAPEVVPAAVPEVAAGRSGRGPVPRRVRLNGGVIPGQRVGD